MRTTLRATAGLASLLTAVGCYGPPAPVVGAPRATSEATGAPEPQLATLLSYEIEAPPDRAKILTTYCAGTGLTQQTRGEVTTCGPFWSRFEATLIAGLVPGASVQRLDVYPDPTTPEPWKHVSAPYARSPIEVGSKRMFERRFALVSWKIDGNEASRKRWSLESEDPAAPLPERADVELELYEIRGSDPQLLIKLPWSHPYDVSTGLAAAATRSTVTLLEVRSSPPKAGVKSEQLRGFLTGKVTRDRLFDVPLSSWTMKPGSAAAKLTVSRVAPAPGGLRITPYAVALTFSAAAKDVAVEKNAWTDVRWQGVSPLPDLVGEISIAKGKPFDESLETIE